MLSSNCLSDCARVLISQLSLEMSKSCYTAFSIAVASRCRMGGIPAVSGKGERLLLYIGIIDILQSYR